MSNTKRTKVFVSYAHEDKRWLARLKVHLKPLERDGIIDRWDDTRIEPGKRWRDEIKVAISKAKVAVLFFSADFLASDFISKDELPPLLGAAETDGLIIIPVIVKPCRFEQTPTISRYQSINSPNEPLIGMTESDREALWVKLSQRIEECLRDDTKHLPSEEERCRNAVGVNWPTIPRKNLTKKMVVDLAKSLCGHRWIGDLVATAMEKVGTDGIIIVEESYGTECSLLLVEGTRFESGFVSPYFINNQKQMSCELKNVMILIHSGFMSRSEELRQIVLNVTGFDKSLMFIAEGFTEEVIDTLVNLATNNRFSIVAVKLPENSAISYEDILQDLAVLTGGKVISDLSQHNEEKCGYAKRIIVTRSNTTIIDTRGSETICRNHVKQLRTCIEESPSPYQKKQFEIRLSNFVAGVAIIRVGAGSIKELKKWTLQIEKVVARLQDWISHLPEH